MKITFEEALAVCIQYYVDRGYERQWQVEYVKYKYLKPLVEELEVQLHEESA